MSSKRVKQSASQDIPASLTSPAPDRLSGLEQQLFDMICKHVVNDEKNVFLNRAICALHCVSKTLHDKTSAWVCKSGIMMTEFGLDTLRRMANVPQVGPRIDCIKLFFPANKDFYRRTKMDELNKAVSILNECFVKFKNLRKIELKAIPVKIEDCEEEDPRVDTTDHFKWSISSLLDVVHTSGAHITELIYDEAVGSWAWVRDENEDEKGEEYLKYPPGALSSTQLSCLQNIEKFRVVDSNVLLNGTNWRFYTEEMLDEMPKLKELTITTPDKDEWLQQEGMRGVMESGVGYDIGSSNGQLFDTSYIGSDYSRVARDAWSNLFRTILDKTFLIKGRFGGLSHWFYAKDRPSRVAVRAAMCWEPDKSSELDSGDTEFAEVAKVRGLRSALEDGKEGMVMVRMK
ncbi:hypothetical protein DBV05_g12226 [Lasiodiplodia theobromae]|uniref:Uncharacterized protein n=1 Tax=Lasiodiplodia theobromae TaxID=45133 RepID=A0A5N5CUS7_9PEZI|nr:hypothetical protein DBV05_g12226 [Lasiodiplodia theobromae]